MGGVGGGSHRGGGSSGFGLAAGGLAESEPFVCSNSAFSLRSSTEGCQAFSRGTPEDWEHAALQLLQLQRAPASGPVSPSDAQQAAGGVQQQQPPARGRHQTRHVLRQRSAGSPQAQTSSWADKKEQRPPVPVSGT